MDAIVSECIRAKAPWQITALRGNTMKAFLVVTLTAFAAAAWAADPFTLVADGHHRAPRVQQRIDHETYHGALLSFWWRGPTGKQVILDA
jgi:hypothetical protein